MARYLRGQAIDWHKSRVFVSEVFSNEEIGLEEMDEDVNRVFVSNTELPAQTPAESAALRT